MRLCRRRGIYESSRPVSRRHSAGLLIDIRPCLTAPPWFAEGPSRSAAALLYKLVTVLHGPRLACPAVALGEGGSSANSWPIAWCVLRRTRGVHHLGEES